MDLLARPLTDLPFVVVDVETTGLRPKNDRIVEVAVADLRAGKLDGLLIDTLVDPERDVGPTHVHGVTAEMVQGAPKFREVAPAVSAALRQGIVVGHNLPFDLRFLDAESTAAGVGPLGSVPRLCTLSLARRLFPRAGSYQLEALCSRLGLSNRQAHSAAGDAVVTAELLDLLLAEAMHRGARSFGDLVQLGPQQPRLVPVVERTPLPAVPQRPRSRVRSSMGHRRGAFMSRLVAARSDGSRHDGCEDLDTYLELLDRVLRDRMIDLAERETPSRVVAEWNLNGVDLERAHRTYLEGLAAAAWSDGTVTDTEREDLERVADLVAIPRDELSALARPGRPRTDSRPRSLQSVGRGRSVCMTGAFAGPRGGGMQRHDAETYAEQAGFKVSKGVTKKLDLLVVADPNTTSVKARKARKYGIEVVAESVFWRELGLA